MLLLLLGQFWRPELKPVMNSTPEQSLTTPVTQASHQSVLIPSFLKGIKQRNIDCPAWDSRGMKQETMCKRALHWVESQWQMSFVPWTSDSRNEAILYIGTGWFKKQNS